MAKLLLAVFAQVPYCSMIGTPPVTSYPRTSGVSLRNSITRVLLSFRTYAVTVIRGIVEMGPGPTVAPSTLPERRPIRQITAGLAGGAGAGCSAGAGAGCSAGAAVV